MGPKRRIAAVTTSRADFGLFEAVLDRIRSDETLELRLLASGAHFVPAYGPTIREIEELGYAYERVEMPFEADSPAAISQSIGVGVQGFAGAFARARPDLLVVIGDRIEMLGAAYAAAPFNIPVAHLYGGKVSEGAIDELSRHALTKMSHLHFATSATHARRVAQMGEEPWRIFNVGSPGLDRMHKYPRATRDAVCRELGLDPARPFVLVTFHPVTLEAGQRGEQVAALVGALEQCDAQLVVTYPNADSGSSDIIAALERLAAAHPQRVRLLKNAGARLYFDLLASAAAMLGNSSSGIGEAPSFELPVVNIGTRQAGFERAANVIDVGHGTQEILAALKRAMSPAFRAGLRGLENPYGDGRSSERIVRELRAVPIDDRLLRKKFVDWKPPS